MIRAVIDTNVFVSALLTKKQSSPFQLYKAFIEQKFLLITSPAILSEIEDVMNREKLIKLHMLSSKQRQGVMEQLYALCYLIQDSATGGKVIVERDPADDKFLHAAEKGHANAIVSGDRDLLELTEYKGIPILTAHEFLILLQK